ncbi:hypothetical protein QZH41_009683 [Actinostola sp. cb2023]|nr:hypothetical protein QZH41_009683 [Actinostola sp. cb2023]
MYSIIALLLNALVAFCLAADQCIPSTVKEYSSCACKLNSTNKYINLSPLQNASVVPRFTTNTSNIKQEENWYFSYNPCKPFDMFVQVTNHSCKDVAVSDVGVGRWTSLTSSPTRQSVCQDLGDQNNVVFDTTPFNLTQYGFDWSNVTLKFTPASLRWKVAVAALVFAVNPRQVPTRNHRKAMTTNG